MRMTMNEMRKFKLTFVRRDFISPEDHLICMRVEAHTEKDAADFGNALAVAAGHAFTNLRPETTSVLVQADDQGE